ncbi:hypothetical protein OIU77_008531 [Salix suchowensis]|uniref:Uncharacterized protein n=1 Tax=Salix suchowensis TaxID=1278906 RepID=A0ABQ9AB77_9ROSI|nr:hypothetical protein OIU77_008531 [Salix suchowensis]
MAAIPTTAEACDSNVPLSGIWVTCEFCTPFSRYMGRVGHSQAPLPLSRCSRTTCWSGSFLKPEVKEEFLSLMEGGARGVLCSEGTWGSWLKTWGGLGFWSMAA